MAASISASSLSLTSTRRGRPFLRWASRQRFMAMRYVQVKNDESPLNDGRYRWTLTNVSCAMSMASSGSLSMPTASW